MLTLSPELEACIAENDLKTLRCLLRAIPDKKAKGMAAIKLIASKAPLEKIEAFLEAGADAEVKHMYGTMEVTPLMFASRTRMDYVKLLLRFGANVNAKNDKGCTALSIACARGKISIANLLLENGASISLLTDSKECILTAALVTQDQAADTMRFLISKGAPMDNVDHQGLTPLMHAVERGFGDCVEALLKAGANPNFVRPKDGISALLLASHLAGNNPVNALVAAKSLVKYGANVNAVGPDGVTPLIVCCSHASSTPIVQFLLQHGANVDAVCTQNIAENITPLSLACQSEIRIVELLLQAGADPNQNVGDSTLLERSTCMTITREPVVHLLLKAGADANLPLKASSRTIKPLINAVIRQDHATVELLLQYGANKFPDPENKRRLLDLAVKLNKTDMIPVFAFPGCGVDVAEEKPARLTEEELLFNFTFSFCAQCRGERRYFDLMMCAGCRMVAYCNKDCQNEHWQKHKKICKQKQANDELARTTDNCV